MYRFLCELKFSAGPSLWLSSRDSTCNAGDGGDVGSIRELGRSPGVGNGNPPQYSCLESPTLCDPMNCSKPGLPVHHQIP